jgi:DNA-binding MarR family transcriptional regulator
MFHLRRSSRAVSRLYSGILDDIGLDSGHFSALMIISRLGPLSISDVANRMGLERTTMSRNLKSLSKQQLIKIGDSGHGRTRQVELTEKGNKVLLEAIPRWEASQSRLRKLIGEEDMEALNTLLARVYAVTQADSK